MLELVNNISINEQALTIKVLAEDLRFPEGPAFAPDGSLWLVELHGESLVNYRNGAISKHKVGGKPNGIAIDKDGKLFFCDAGMNAVRLFDPATASLSIVVDNINGQPLNAPNDLAFDADGNLLFTCPGNSRQEPTGYVCVLQKDGTTRKITEGKYFPNGLAFANNGTELIIAETYAHRLWKGKWDSEECTWYDEKVFAETGGPIGPDGMAIAMDGTVYVAVFGTGKVKAFDSTGQLKNEIELLGSKPSNCAFDPNNNLGLVVTEAEHGRLLSVQIDAKGLSLFNHQAIIS